MSLTKIGLTLSGLVVLVLVGFATDWQFGLGSSKSPLQEHAAEAPVPAGATVGDHRNRHLKDLTRLYVSRNSDSPSRMKDGQELAPAEFLNDELKRSGAKWRVRNSNGATAETYDIS